MSRYSMMLLLRLAVLITFGLSCAVALATDSNNVVKSNPTIKDTQALRFLRRYAFDEEANRENEDEERGIGVSKQLDDVLLKADEVIGISKNVVRKVGGALIKNSRETDEYLRLTRALSGKYPTAKELGLSTLRQLKKIEAVRKKDIEKGIDVSKAATDGMHRDIKLVDGIKRVPDKYMGAHVGRDQQRFTEADTRSLAAGVVTRTNKKGEQKILLVSSSKPTKYEFMISKGVRKKTRVLKWQRCVRSLKKEGYVDRSWILGAVTIYTHSR